MRIENDGSTITIETEEVWIIQRRRVLVRSFCRDCGRESSMVSPDEAARLAFRDVGSIRSSMENGVFHVFYVNDSQPMICLNSLCAG